MKRTALLAIVYWLWFYTPFSYASSDPTITPKDFRNLIGCWKGSLTYLDYSTNKPFSMTAGIIVRDFKKSNLIICSFLYPDEPGANSSDTIFISNDGRLLNKETIKAKKKINKDSLEIITENPGIDGNDNKLAVIRHTYILGKTTYSVKKEVQFEGQTSWILRNEYNFIRMISCN